MERAKEYFKAAEWALANGLLNVCALCCYAALFWATIVALEHQGFKRAEWAHGALKDTFTNVLIKQRHIYPAVFGAWLSDAYRYRTIAHYKREKLSVKVIRRLVDHVREFVTKVEEVTKA
ncbi:MAG: hypothetical protein HY709_11015 [Candidatus Latescibacteria bacterium]|nr:hypothetical protein [Candidatus Latescibacterota bacterium]